MGLPIMAGLSIDERGRAMGGKAGDNNKRVTALEQGAK